MKPLNDGSRPSRLAQARALTGEVDELAGTIPDGTFAAAVAGAAVPAFDFAALSARAAALPSPDFMMEDPVSTGGEPSPGDERPQRVSSAAERQVPLGGHGPAQRRTPARWRTWVPRFALAAVALTALFVVGEPWPSHHSGLKGGESDLGFFVEHGGDVTVGDPSNPVSPGDGIQFSYRTQASRLVLLSVDAEGVVTVFWPAPNHAPPDGRGVEVIPGDRRVLDGSVVLDDAPSPEVFVAFFGDWTVSAARSRAASAYASGGIDSVTDLGETSRPQDEGDIAVLALEKVD